MLEKRKLTNLMDKKGNWIPEQVAEFLKNPRAMGYELKYPMESDGRWCN
jgi:hypothetical protein